MVLALDASSVFSASGFLGASPETIVSTAFTPPVGANLVICANAGDSFTGTLGTAPTITDSLGTHLTYTSIANPSVSGTAGQVRCWWSSPVLSSVSMTVSVTFTGRSGQTIAGDQIGVLVCTGAAATPVSAATVSGVTVAGTAFSKSITPTVIGSMLFLTLACSNSSTFTAGTSMFNKSTSSISEFAGLIAWMGVTGGPTTTTSLTAFALAETLGTSRTTVYVGLEVVPAAVAAGEPELVVPTARGWG